MNNMYQAPKAEVIMIQSNAPMMLDGTGDSHWNEGDGEL